MKKKSTSTELEEERGKRGGWRKMLRRQGPLGLRCPFFPLRGARAYWCKMALCLSETPASWMELSWSNALWDRSVKLFFAPPPTHPTATPCFVFCFLQLPYFNLSGIKDLALHWLWYCCVYFYAVSLPLLLFWSNNNSELLDAEQSLPPTRPIVDSSFWFFFFLVGFYYDYNNDFILFF